MLVRSFLLAQVRIEPWQPRFEIPHRRIVTTARAERHLRKPGVTGTRISLRALAEAGLD